MAAVCLLAVGCGPDAKGGGGGGADTGPQPGADARDAAADAGVDAAPDTSPPRPDTSPEVDGGADVAVDAAPMSDAGEPDASETGTDAGPTPSYHLYAASQTGSSSSEYLVAEVGPATSAANSVIGSQTYGIGDLAVTKSDGRPFVLNRRCSGPGGSGSCMSNAGEVLHVGLDASSMLAASTTLSLPTDVFNPQGVGYVAAANRYVVSSYADPRVFTYDASGSRRSTSWDTSPFDAGSTTTDKDPEVSDILVDGNFVLVNLLRLSGFMPQKNSALAVIDIQNGEFVDFDTTTPRTDALELPGKNSFAGLRRTGSGNFAVGFTGSFGSQDGGITLIERSAAGDYTVGGEIVSESTLGGDLNGFVMTSDTEGYALVSSTSSGSFTTRLKHFTTTSSGGQVSTIQAIENATGAICITPDRRQVWVADKASGHEGLWGIATGSDAVVNSQAVAPGGTVRSCRIVAGD